jgi:hypothetical protein
MTSTKRPQTTSMSPDTSPLPAAILWDEPVHLGWRPSWMLIMLSRVLTGKRLRPTTWQFWYSNPLSPHFLQTTPTIPRTTTTCHLYFDPGAIFQVCRHVRARRYETLTVVTWHMLSVVLQGKTLTAYIWNTVCKLHAAQTATLKTLRKFHSSVASSFHPIHTQKVRKTLHKEILPIKGQRKNVFIPMPR